MSLASLVQRAEDNLANLLRRATPTVSIDIDGPVSWMMARNEATEIKPTLQDIRIEDLLGKHTEFLCSPITGGANNHFETQHAGFFAPHAIPSALRPTGTAVTLERHEFFQGKSNASDGMRRKSVRRRPLCCDIGAQCSPCARGQCGVAKENSHI
jgi:hypothetical protein